MSDTLIAQLRKLLPYFALKLPVYELYREFGIVTDATLSVTNRYHR